MDLRCQNLPTSLKCKSRTVAGPIFRTRDRLGSRTVQRLVCRKVSGIEGREAAESDTPLSTLLKNGTAALLGVATTALVGTPSSLAVDQYLPGASAGRSKTQQQDLERIVEQRSGGQSLSDLLNVKQVDKHRAPVPSPSAPSVTLPSPAAQLLQARLPHIPAPSLRDDFPPGPGPITVPHISAPQNQAADSTTQTSQIKQLEIRQALTQRGSNQGTPGVATQPSLDTAAQKPLDTVGLFQAKTQAHSETWSGLRSLWNPPSLGQLPFQLAAIGTSFTADSSAIGSVLQDWSKDLAQPALISLSANVNALRDGTTVEAALQQAATSKVALQSQVTSHMSSLGDAVAPAKSQVSHLLGSLGDQWEVVLEKGNAVPATMVLQMQSVVDSLSLAKSGVARSASDVVSGVQEETAHLGSLVGNGVHDLAGNAKVTATNFASLSVNGLERALGGSGLASEQLGILASVLASSTALGTVGFASKRKLEAQNQDLIAQLEMTTADHEASLSSLQTRIHNLQDSLASVESQMAFADHNYNTKLAATGLELTRVADLLRSEQEANDLVAKERNQLIRDLDLARLERQQLSAEADTIRQQLEEAHLQWSERESQCQRLEEELRITVAERLALRKVLEQLQHNSQQQLTAAAAMEETYATRLGSLEKQVHELTQALSSTEQNLDTTDAELREVLEANMELHESLEHQTSKHADQLAHLEQDWSLRITMMENKYIERLSDIEQEYEERLQGCEMELKKTRAELEQQSGLASNSTLKLKLVEEQLKEVCALKLELEAHQQQLELKYLEFEAETLTTIKTLQAELQEERQQHALLLCNTGEMQGLVAGLQSEKEVLAEELEALRVSTGEQIRAAFADSAQLQQLNMKLESQLATMRLECDQCVAEAKAEMLASIAAAAKKQEEAEMREKMASNQVEVTQQQLREAVTEGTQAAMQLSSMEQEFRELANKALQDNVDSENKLLELSGRYQAVVATLKKELVESEDQVKAVEADFEAELQSTKAAAETIQASLAAQQTESSTLKQQVEELKESLGKTQEEATQLAAAVEKEKQLRADLEAQSTEVAARLEKTYNIQLHFAEKENMRLAGLLEQEQASAQELREKLEHVQAEGTPALELVSIVEAERDAFKEEQEKLRLALEEQAEMNHSLKARIVELETSNANALATTSQQLEEAQQQLHTTAKKLQATAHQLEEAATESQSQAELNSSLKKRIDELESANKESLIATDTQLAEANQKLMEATQKLEEADCQLVQLVQQSEAAADAAEAEKTCNQELQLQVQELKQQLVAVVEQQEGSSAKFLKELEQVKEERAKLARVAEEEKQAQQALMGQVALLQASQSAAMRALEDERRRSHKAVEEESGRSRSLKSQVSELQRRLERHSKMAITTSMASDSHAQHKRVSALEREKQEAEAALSEGRNQLEAMRQKLEENNQSLDRLSKENHELQNEKVLNACLKRRLSELQRDWGTDADQERILTLLQVEQTKAEEMERTALRAQREKREVEARLETQMLLAKERTEELEAQCKELKDKLKKAEVEKDDDEDKGGSGRLGSHRQLVEQIAQWKKDHQIMLELQERTCSSKIEALRQEYEDKLERGQKATQESELVQVLKSDVHDNNLAGEMHTTKALLSSMPREHSNVEVSRLRSELQRHVREAASAQEAAYIARCKLDEECRARMAVEDMLKDLRHELEHAKVWEQQVMADVEKQNASLFGGSFRSIRQAERGREDSGDSKGPRWAFGLA